MNEGLIEQRHPILGALRRAWQEGRMDTGEIPDALAPHIVRLHRDRDIWHIAASGAAVDLLYGIALTGLPANLLTPGQDDSAIEVDVALESGRPLLLEDDVRLASGDRRVARLYLPLPNLAPAKPVILCGVVASD